MNRGSTCREKSQNQTASGARGVRRAPRESSRDDRVQEPGAGKGTAAKDAGKPKPLLKKSSKVPNVTSPFRTKISEEKTNGPKTSPNIRVPERSKSPTKALNQTTKKSDRSMSFAAKPKVGVRAKTSKDETRPKKIADRKEEEPEISDNTEENLRAKITGAIINYIKSTPFKRQVSDHIVWEISVKIAKAVSQYHEQQQARSVRKAKAGALHKNPARKCRPEQSCNLGFSISVASLLGYELIESRDKMIEYFQSKSAEQSTSSNAETEIVKNVFESILEFVINIETLHPVEEMDTYSPDRIMDSFESILQSINSSERESPFHEPTLKDDESGASSTVSPPADKSDLEPLLAKEVVPSKDDALKVEDLGPQEPQEPQERNISGPRKFIEKLKSFLTSATSDQDQSSEVDAKEKNDAKDEDEKIQSAFIPETQTTAIEHNLKPHEEAEEQLVAENDVDEQDLQPSEHQEPASPVPSPPASEKPDSPRESPETTTCPPEQTSYSPDLPVSIPETSDTETTSIIQKEEDDLQHTLPLSDMEKTVSFESEEKDEEIEMSLKPGQEQFVDEPDVDIDQVLATPFEKNVPCEATEQDLQPTRQEERASPVPSLPSTVEPASLRKSAARSTHPTRRTSSLYSTKKPVKKGSVLVATPSRLKDSRMLSKTLDIKKSMVRKVALPGFKKEQRQATADNTSNQSLEAPKTEPVDTDSKTMAGPTKPDVPEVKPSECTKKQTFFWSTIYKKKTAPDNKKRMDFGKCCSSCTCDHQEEDQ